METGICLVLPFTKILLIGVLLLAVLALLTLLLAIATGHQSGLETAKGEMDQAGRGARRQINAIAKHYRGQANKLGKKG